MNRTEPRASTTETRRSGTFSRTDAFLGSAGAATGLAVHSLGHGNLWLSLAIGAVPAAPVLAKTLLLVTWTILLALYAVLAAAFGIIRVIIKLEDPADYFSEALGKFTNVCLAFSSGTPWTPPQSAPGPAPQPEPAPRPQAHQIHPPQPQPTFVPRQPATSPGLPGQLGVVHGLDPTPAPVEIPQGTRPHGSQRGRHVAA